MGDRCTCTLEVGGTVSSADLKTLLKVLESEYADYQGQGDEIDLFGGGEQPGAIWWFEEVNYGDMMDEIESALEAMGLSYAWFNEAGGGYGQGFTFHDAQTEETVKFDSIEHEIALTLTSITDERLAEARKWEKWHIGLVLNVKT